MGVIIDLALHRKDCPNCRWYGQKDQGCLRPGGWHWLPGYKGCADFEWSEAAKNALREEREKGC